MSKDIHKWTNGRYTLMFDEHTFFVWDNEKDERMTALNVTKKLNEQQATINELEQENADLLGDNIRSLDEFEKCTNKLKAKILEQQSTITELKKENEKFDYNYSDLKQENGELRSKIGEQQATISQLKEENEKLAKMLNANYKTNNELVQYIQMLERDNDE